MENRTVQFEPVTQRIGIADIAVMCQCHFPFLVIDLDRLTVAAVVSTGCSVTDMTDTGGCRREFCQYLS